MEDEGGSMSLFIVERPWQDVCTLSATNLGTLGQIYSSINHFDSHPSFEGLITLISTMIVVMVNHGSLQC